MLKMTVTIQSSLGETVIVGEVWVMVFRDSTHAVIGEITVVYWATARKQKKKRKNTVTCFLLLFTSNSNAFLKT